MATKVSQPMTVTAKAMARVIEQQGESPHWDGKAHAACLAYIAEECTKDGQFDRKAFMAVLNQDTELLYASNTKKWLIALGDLPASVASTEGYE